MHKIWVNKDKLKFFLKCLEINQNSLKKLTFKLFPEWSIRFCRKFNLTLIKDFQGSIYLESSWYDLIKGKNMIEHCCFDKV